jgi:REP element-mobilizing transposase RayT
MVHGYHIILSAYGFWLPNDPRGSWSEMVESWHLFRFGCSTKEREPRSLRQLTPQEHRQREAARRSLKYPAVRFNDGQVAAIVDGFAKACHKNQYTIWACAVLPEHTHLVVARHRYSAEQIANLLKGAATKSLVAAGLHPLASYAVPGKAPPHMWAEKVWTSFLDSETSIEQAIDYVEQNPIREEKPRQYWPFVTPFAGLPNSGWTRYCD